MAHVKVKKPTYKQLTQHLADAHRHCEYYRKEIIALNIAHKSALDVLRRQLDDKHVKEVNDLIRNWGQSNESFSRAIQALKGVL